MESIKGEQPATQAVSVSASEQDLRGSATEPKVGELLPGEAEAGGLGRHLGLWSTVALMFVFCLIPDHHLSQTLFGFFADVSQYRSHYRNWHLLYSLISGG